ncbi:MAG: phosphatidylglycerophosphatase A [Candidatus Omnitrophica bacterium]|nr:phosphatidylglycerophosphatase A [Candidatus Omnitrophota bacterium]
MKNLHENISTLFGLGRIPFAPGTWGSFAGLLVAIVFRGSPLLLGLLFALLFPLGVFSSGVAERRAGKKDPSDIIIDEFVCILPIFIITPAEPFYFAAGFLFYRLIDIIKPPPLGYCEKIKGGWGIMLDDLGAAVYTTVILRLLSLLI